MWQWSRGPRRAGHTAAPNCVSSPSAGGPASPADAGLPAGGARRRTPGLRRAEVAVLAGVGASWFQWLEQGRDIEDAGQIRKELDHPVAWLLRLESSAMRMPGPPRSDDRAPHPAGRGHRGRAGVAGLAGGRRGALYPVAG
ncbi:hypothetical protein GCM10027075_49860 [Streptomyces heilongjiangensis]